MISKADREQFALLAFHVFFQYSTKPIVAVTSALTGDGRGYVGAGLVRALAMSGRSTVLIEVTGNNETAMTTLQTYSVNSSFNAMRMEDRIVADARETRRALSEINARFDVLVIVLDDLFTTSMNLELLSVSSCVVITIAMGRRAEQADLRLRDFLTALEKPIAGVVPTFEPVQSTTLPALAEATPLGANRATPTKIAALAHSRTGT